MSKSVTQFFVAQQHLQLIAGLLGGNHGVGFTSVSNWAS